MLTAIEFAWIDPWTGEFCAGAYMPWNKRRAAAAFYSRQIRAMKPLAKELCGPRTPRLRIVFHRTLTRK